MNNIYLTLLDQARWMREIDGMGYLDGQESLAVGEQVKGPFLINCHRLAYAAVKRGKSLEHAFSGVSSDIDSFFTEMRLKNVTEADPEDGEYLKEALRPLIEKQWNRSPISRLVSGTLDSHPQLVFFPIMAVFLGLISLAAYFGAFEK